MTDSTPKDDPQKNGLSRRIFLKGAGIFVAGAAGLSACDPIEDTAQDVNLIPAQPTVTPTPLPTQLQYSEVPPSPHRPPAPGLLQFFTPQEAQTVEAVTARILPGTPDDPGAREAGVVFYIDNLLAFREGYPEAIYREAPWVQTYTSEAPPPANGYNVLYVPDDEIERYGYQSILTPREVYRIGVAALDAHARANYQGKAFRELSEDEQDEMIERMVDDEMPEFVQFSALAFFHVLRRHVSEGMFSDPVYGGNRDMVGWNLIGYPGAQRAYTPDDIITPGSIRESQSLMQLHEFHPGQDVGDHVILPVSGSDYRSND